MVAVAIIANHLLLAGFAIVRVKGGSDLGVLQRVIDREERSDPSPSRNAP